MPSTVTDLRAALAALSLDSRGNKDTLKKRLLRASKKSPSPPSQAGLVPETETTATTKRQGRPRRPHDQQFDSFLVFDVEATCERIDEPWGKFAFAYPNEIIEWPVVLLQWQRSTVGSQDDQDDDDDDHDEFEEEDQDSWHLVQVDEFHSFVKPTWANRLSSFCTELTGITQADLETAPTFSGLCDQFHRDFIQRHGLFTPDNRTVWVTDGPWDLRDFVAKTCYLSSTPRPAWLAGEIIDLRLLTSLFFATVKKEKKKARSPSPPSGAPVPTSTAASVGPTTMTENEQDDNVLPPPVPLVVDPTPAPPSGDVSSLAASATTTTDYLPSHLLTAPATLSLPSVLAALSLPAFQGRLHSGLADARNASRILIDLAARGMSLAPNRRVPESGRGRERRWPWMEPGRRAPENRVDLGTVQQRWEEYLRKEKVKEGQIAALAAAAGQ
ncbi:hypothetical protein C6P46_006569 [Rhodotorula mucilaginosa]|uniref:SAP domain-containing protein n=1 Tax=Rhodotorula mucilaginosa TaxID=5537 RepID=A0A9P7B3A6_RHOMI|nr:hypothetical protein C6P46_006569 [Rhodotorula mucilaginosa]